MSEMEKHDFFHLQKENLQRWKRAFHAPATNREATVVTEIFSGKLLRVHIALENSVM